MHTVTEKLLTYALGRGLEYYDMPAVRRIVTDAAAGRLPDAGSIVLAIVEELSVPVSGDVDPDGVDSIGGRSTERRQRAERARTHLDLRRDR